MVVLVFSKNEEDPNKNEVSRAMVDFQNVPFFNFVKTTNSLF